MPIKSLMQVLSQLTSPVCCISVFIGTTACCVSIRLGRTLLAQFPQELIGWHEERVLLQRAADDNHRMGSQNVKNYSATEFGDMTGSLYRGKM